MTSRKVSYRILKRISIVAMFCSCTCLKATPHIVQPLSNDSDFHLYYLEASLKAQRVLEFCEQNSIILQLHPLASHSELPQADSRQKETPFSEELPKSASDEDIIVDKNRYLFEIGSICLDDLEMEKGVILSVTGPIWDLKTLPQEVLVGADEIIGFLSTLCQPMNMEYSDSD